VIYFTETGRLLFTAACRITHLVAFFTFFVIFAFSTQRTKLVTLYAGYKLKHDTVVNHLKQEISAGLLLLLRDSKWV